MCNTDVGAPSQRGAKCAAAALRAAGGHLIAALVKMTKKHTKKNKISPFRGGVSFFFVCFLVIFNCAAIAGLTGDTAGRCGALGVALAWRGDVSVACFLSFCWLFDTNFLIL